MIAAPPPAALTASPARIELAGSASRTIRVTNPGRLEAVVDATPAGFGLDLRGRPRIVVRRDPSVRISVRPHRVALRSGATASVVVSSALGVHARPGDHALLVLLATRPRGNSGVAVRMRVGVVVVVRVPGAVVRRLDVRGLRMHRPRLVEVALWNGGNVVEHIGARTFRIVLRRRGRVLATLHPAPRELLPGTRGVVEIRCRTRVHGRVSATVELAGRAAVFRIRLP